MDEKHHDDLPPTFRLLADFARERRIIRGKEALEPRKESGIPALKIPKAYYIKLGEKGQWEESSISNGLMRFGWKIIPLDDIVAKNWTAIETRLRAEFSNQGAATRDLKALRIICESIPSDVWVTFFSSRLWWCRLTSDPMEEDSISKYRKVDGSWSDKDINGRPLLTSQIPGKLSQLQGFRGTVCHVKEVEALERLINGIPSLAYLGIQEARANLVSKVKEAIATLHWKDFETLVDLVFRQAGWRRISMLGETMKYADLELREPITEDLYQVQIKSRADLNDLQEYVSKFSKGRFRRLYFVVHSPSSSLLKHAPSSKTNVELILPERLAEMIVDLGLMKWVMDKIRV